MPRNRVGQSLERRVGDLDRREVVTRVKRDPLGLSELLVHEGQLAVQLSDRWHRAHVAIREQPRQLSLRGQLRSFRAGDRPELVEVQSTCGRNRADRRAPVEQHLHGLGPLPTRNVAGRGFLLRREGDRVIDDFVLDSLLLEILLDPRGDRPRVPPSGSLHVRLAPGELHRARYRSRASPAATGAVSSATRSPRAASTGLSSTLMRSQ